MDEDGPTSLQQLVYKNPVRLLLKPDSRTLAEVYEEILDIISFYMDDPEEEDLRDCEQYINEELRIEFPGHSAIVRGYGATAKVVIQGPKYGFRCSVTRDTVDIDDDF